MNYFKHVIQRANRPGNPRSRMPRGTSILQVLAVILGSLFLALAAGCGSAASYLVFTSDRDGNLDIYSVDLGSGRQTNLTSSPGDEWAPAVSPDRRQVAFQSGSKESSKLEIIGLNGELRTLLTPGAGAYYSQQWSPGSDRIAYVAHQSTPSALYVTATSGFNPLLLTALPGDEIGAWSRDGNAIAFAVREGEAQGIYIRNPDGVNEFRLTQTPDFSPVWSPDSRRLAFLSTRDGNAELYVMDADGSNQRRLTDTAAPEYSLSWSPNGKQLLFVSEQEGNAEIYVIQLEGLQQTRLTFNNVRDEQPVWSPSGSNIAFVSYLDGDAEIFVMDADGKNQRRLTNNSAQDTSPSW